jgi:uncharacterized protein YyaL (SSP411 family)
LTDGTWQDYEAKGSLKAIDARVSWGLLLLSKLTGEQRYRDAAYMHLEWVMSHQNPDGWFNYCSFDPKAASVTHMIAYVIEGLIESGLIIKDDQLIASGKKAADALLGQLHESGYLCGAFREGWKPVSRSSCLTGNAQMARIWLCLAEITRSMEYYIAAERAIRFIASTQPLDRVADNIRGGIAGSWPLSGQYMTFKYLNWATNFFADAILKWNRSPVAKGE